MDDYTYTLLVGAVCGAWALVAAYAIAEWVATLRARRRDKVRRFFVEAGNGARLAELARAMEASAAARASGRSTRVLVESTREKGDR